MQRGFLLLEITAKVVTVAVSWLRKVNATSGTFTQACVAGAVLKHLRELLNSRYICRQALDASCLILTG
jgi:hypothetical protein